MRKTKNESYNWAAKYVANLRAANPYFVSENLWLYMSDLHVRSVVSCDGIALHRVDTPMITAADGERGRVRIPKKIRPRIVGHNRGSFCL